MLLLFPYTDKNNIDDEYGDGEIARAKQENSSGHRTIIYYRYQEKAFFIYGWLKSERANIDEDEDEDEDAAFKQQAKLRSPYRMNSLRS